MIAKPIAPRRGERGALPEREAVAPRPGEAALPVLPTQAVSEAAREQREAPPQQGARERAGRGPVAP